jgi:LacI family transcriptional regulator
MREMRASLRALRRATDFPRNSYYHQKRAFYAPRSCPSAQQKARMNAVTIADVAALAGVSESTVSRALSMSRPVGADVQSRVRAAATELGYSGNSIARALRKQKTDTVGMVVPSILNPFFTTLVDSMENALLAEGKQLFLCDSRQDPALEAHHLRLLIERHVDGIVISPVDSTASTAAIASAARSVPLVQLDRHVDVENTDWVGIDDAEAMKLVLTHLHSTGVRSAAFVTSQLTNSSTEQRLAGFRIHAAALGIEVDEDWVVLGDYSVDSGDAAAQRLIASARRPEAIVCADDLIAFGVLRACREAGLRVPEDVQVTGFDNIVFSEHVTPSLTSIDQPTARMAAETLRLLALRTKSRDSGGGANVSLKPRLIVRNSTLPVGR